jgi:hypothetical protein
MMHLSQRRGDTHGVHGGTPVPIPTRPDADAGQQGLNEQDTTAQVEGATSWRRDSGVATQRSGTQHEGQYPVCIGREGGGDDVERQLHRHGGISGEVAMGLGLVMRRKMAVRGGILLLVMVVCDRVVITEGRGCARMGKQDKGGLSAHPVVHHNVHGGAKKCKKNSTAHEAHHR